MEVKGSRKNKFTEFSLRFRLDLVDLTEHPKGLCFAARNRGNSRALLRIS